MIDMLRGWWPQKQPQVVGTAVVDGTTPEVQVWALHRLDQLQEAVKDNRGDVVATVDIYRPENGAPVADRERAYIDRLLSAEKPAIYSHWSGHRSYVIDARKVVVAEQFDTAGERLASQLQANLKRYPKAYHVVYAFGHRHTAREVAGIPLPQWREALQSDKSVGLVLLDTCFGASIEVLSHFPRNVQTVAASEIRLQETVRVHDFVTPIFESQFPLRDILANLANYSDHSPQNVGRMVVRQGTRRQGEEHIVSAADLNKLHSDLLPALQAAAPHLASDTSAARAIRWSPPVDMGTMTDLMGFLVAAAQNVESAATAAACTSASAALSRSVIARGSSPGLDRHGDIAFQRGSGAPLQALPPAWQSFARNVSA